MRKLTKNISMLGAASVLTAATLAGCGSSSTAGNSNSSNSSGGQSSSAKQETITFVAAQYSDNTKPFWTNLIQRFEQKYPNIKVNLQVVGWTAMDQKVNTMISTHQTPDLLNYNEYASFAADGLLNPTSTWVPKDVLNNVYPSFLQSGEINGTGYGLPLLASVRALFYNKDLFKKAGITSPPTTWTQLQQDAVQITKKTGVPGFGSHYTNNEGQADFAYFTWGNGGGFKTNGKWDLNNPKNIQAMQFLHDLTYKYHATNPDPTSINRDQMQPVFEQGKIGMMLTANFFATLIKQQAPNLNYGIGPIPHNTGVKPFTLGVADYLMSFKTSKHPNAVKKFLDFFYQDQNYESWLTKEGMLPVTQSAGAQMAKKDPLDAQFIKLLPIAKFYPVQDPKIVQAEQAVRQAGEAILSNQESAKQALDQAQQQMAGAGN